jgi:hypothetical protein
MFLKFKKKGPLSIKPFEVKNLKFEGASYPLNFKFSPSNGFILRDPFETSFQSGFEFHQTDRQKHNGHARQNRRFTPY